MIRILRLLPGEWSDPLRCELHSSYICKDNQPYMIHYPNPLGEHPTYEALSYTWGDMSTTTTMDLCGHPFSISNNLESALRHLRQDSEWRDLWVDAICIDQSNMPERSAQVLKMAEIYRHASKVIVWLGEESSDSNLAM
ncbi:uncharacterized protein BDZ99DRAFT_399646, partial [Mytilinidion resinicola]